MIFMKKELPRKLFHILFGLLFLCLIYFLGTRTSFKVILILFFIGLFIATAMKFGFRHKVLEKIVSIVERDSEKHFPGKAALIFFGTALILLYLFRSESLIVIAALSVEIFADSFAALIGKKFGKHVIIDKKSYKKTWEGTIACFIIALIILALFVPLWIALIGAIVATIIEFLPANDNIGIPLLVAVVLKLLL
jgi:phytol kinase